MYQTFKNQKHSSVFTFLIHKTTTMTEKELLNERFKIVFEALVKNGEIVKNSREKGMSVFAKKITGNKQYGHIIRAYLKDNSVDSRTITYNQARKLVDYYNVSWSYMLEGKGKIFINQEDLTDYTVLNGSPKSDDGQEDCLDKHHLDNGKLITSNPSQKKNIVFSSLSAFASSTVDIDIHEDSERFYIPKMSGEHIAFYIKGNSMSPTIANGDMVICRALESYDRIIENEIYAIVTKSGNVMVKRVQNILDKNKQVTAFKLISDNYLDHDPFSVPIQDIRELLKVVRKLTEVGL